MEKADRLTSTHSLSCRTRKDASKTPFACVDECGSAADCSFLLMEAAFTAWPTASMSSYPSEKAHRCRCMTRSFCPETKEMRRPLHPMPASEKRTCAPVCWSQLTTRIVDRQCGDPGACGLAGAS